MTDFQYPKSPIEPNSNEEWDLEIKVFNLIGHLPDDDETAQVVRKLWLEFVMREQWRLEKGI